MAVTANSLPPASAQYAPALGSKSFAITKSDTDQLPQVTRGLYVGVAGDVTMKLDGDTAAVLFKAMPAGFYPLAVRQVMSAGTTATNLVGVY